MSKHTTDAPASQGPASEEPHAPPYVLHQYPFRSGPLADEIENLPLYTENHDPNAPIDIRELNKILCMRDRARENDVNIWRRYLDSLEQGKQTDKEREIAKAYIITHYFAAIRLGQEDVIDLLIKNHLTTTNTKLGATTPLLMAVSKKNVGVVKQLLDLGADPNEFGGLVQHLNPYVGIQPTLRTPLQLAASMGHLVLVKLLMEQYHSDDSLIAPDGQIALRLAAENGHREVVDYLPARRGGGFRRWKHKNKTAIRRAKSAAQGIGYFVKFFVWDIEKFFLWSVPKHLIVKPLVKASSWCWEHRKEFGPWCAHQLKETPGRVARFVKWIGRTIGRVGKWLWEVMLKFPTMLKDIAVWLWKVVSKIPKIIGRLATWIWKLVTVKLPKASALLAHWVVVGFTSMAKVIWNAILKLVSFLSTVVAAIVSFFRSLTLKDIWNGFCDALAAVFIALPKMIWSWIMAFGEGSYKMMKIILGEVGEILWYIGYGLLWVVTFIPRKLWIMLESLGGVIAKAGYEIRVWVDPKAR